MTWQRLCNIGEPATFKNILTGRIVTWTEKEKQTVDDAIATKLLASGAGFVLDNDETGEVVTSRIDPVTGD